jgi:iron(III) transport system substrate-binding protein
VVYVEASKRTAGPVLSAFEKRSGIDVQPHYRETLGDDFVPTLKKEIAAGHADLLWAVSPLLAAELALDGLAVPFRPAGARHVPGQYRDPQFRWIGFAANPRVIIYNNNLLDREEAPTSIHDLTSSHWSAKAALASIRSGAPAFHAATLFSLWGTERARAFFEEVRTNGSRIARDDAEVRRLVAAGEALWGFVDLDEAICAKREAEPVHISYPDRIAQGAVVPPHVAALLRHTPNPSQAKGLLGYLLSTDAAGELLQNDCALLTLLPDDVLSSLGKPEWVPPLSTFNVTRLDNDAVLRAFLDNAAYFESWDRPAAPASLARATIE